MNAGVIMMSKFSEFFCEVQTFSDGSYVLSGSFSRIEAAEMFSKYFGEDIEPKSIETDRVRFGFAPDNVEDMGGKPCWYTGAGTGRGTKAIWKV